MRTVSQRSRWHGGSAEFAKMRVRSESIPGLRLTGKHAFRRCGVYARSLILFGCLSVVPVQADTLLHRQAPGRTFGITSDTGFIDDANRQNSSLIADRFDSLPLPVCRVVWWSFYGSSIAQEPEPPPANESIRVRIYANEAGLPGAVLSESAFVNPVRQATGFSIATGAGPLEYRYQVDLPNCYSTSAGSSYWLEVAQLGDVSSRFRWENSNTGGEFASQFPIGSPWRITAGSGQMAYELRTPEPTSGALMGFGLAYLLRRGKR